MGFGRYRNTPLSSITLADSLVGLLSKFRITADIDKAAERAPFRFDPVVDAEFYQDIYWEVADDRQVAAAKRLNKRFDRWYSRSAQPMDKVFLAVVGLTDSDDTIDTIIDDTKAALLTKHQMEFIDADDAIYQITDYHGVRDPVNIRNALNTENINWWCRQFEQQAHRIKNAPTMNFDRFMEWNEERITHENLVQDHFRRNHFARSGLSMRQGRKVLRRTYEHMALFFGEKQTREFCKGQPIEIRAHYFVWRLTLGRTLTLLQYTVDPPNHHIPYSLDLYDHAGQRLASACIVFAGQPVLDQVVQLSVSIDTPENELDVLRTANIFLVTTAGEANEHLNSLHLPNVTRRENELLSDAQIRALLDQHDQELAWRQQNRIEGWACNIDENCELSDFGIDPDTRSYLHEQRTREDELIDSYVEELRRFVDLPLNTNADQGLNSYVRSLYGEVLRDRARTMLRRQRDPIAQQIREELYRRLDVQPDLLEYMALPEFRYMYIGRLKNRPMLRLRQFIERKLPLGTGVLV